MASAQPQAAETEQGQQKPLGYPYRICAAVILERYPVITPDLTPYEQKYNDWAEMIQMEKSKYSITELIEMAPKEEDEFKEAPKTKAKKGKEKKGKEAAAEQGKGKKQKKGAAAEAEAAEEEGEGEDLLVAPEPEETKDATKEVFTPADRVTDADRTNDRRSVSRALQHTLYLLVRELPRKGSGQKAQWRFPQLERTGDETLRQTAERAFRNGIDREGLMRTYFIGNCPSVYIKQEHAADADGTVGSKVFAFRAQWLEGQLSMAKKYSDYVWVKKDEVEEYVSPQYYAEIKDLLRA